MNFKFWKKKQAAVIEEKKIPRKWLITLENNNTLYDVLEVSKQYDEYNKTNKISDRVILWNLIYKIYPEIKEITKTELCALRSGISITAVLE